MDHLVALPGCWIGSWRGIPFHVPDVSSPAGRRLIAIHLPGTDVTIHEDLGRANRAIRVNGLVAGDDYIAQAAALQKAFDAPGPGALVHPWLGPMTVILDEGGADISYRSDALRTASFSATFQRWTPVVSPISTLALVSVAATALAGLSLGLFGAADRMMTVGMGEAMATVAGATLGAVSASLVGAVLVSRISTLTIGGVGISTAAAQVAGAASATAWADAVAGAVAGAGTPPSRAAIGIGPTGRAAEAVVAPWSAVTTLLDIARATTSLDDDERGLALVGAGMAVAAVAAIAAPLAAVDWESRQQAEAARSTISSAIAEVSAALVAMDGGDDDGPAALRAAWRGLAELRRRIWEDIDDRIGRLPSVLTIQPPTRASAWVVAQYVAGDDPTAVRTAFEDIVKRNRLVHPARLDPGVSIEVLPSARSSR